jgi:hypothetical protein
VVGRLVEQQHVRLLEQHAAERDAPLLAAGEVLDRASAGGSRSASIAISILRSRSQRLPASIWSCSFACSSISAFISSSEVISANFMFTSSKRRSTSRWCFTASSTLPRTSSAGSSSGSCGR